MRRPDKDENDRTITAPAVIWANVLLFEASLLGFHACLGGGFKHFLFSPLVEEDFQFD